MDVAVARKVLQMFGRFEMVCSGFVDAVVHCFQCGELDSRASQKIQYVDYSELRTTLYSLLET